MAEASFLVPHILILDCYKESCVIKIFSYGRHPNDSYSGPCTEVAVPEGIVSNSDHVYTNFLKI
jgi:hypothetical protein